MNKDVDVIALYEEVARLSGNMLTAAQQRDWDRLTELESGCATCVERLKGCETASRLGEQARSKKIALLTAILDNDREIRNITEPWMAELEALLGSAGNACKLNRGYGGDEGG